VLLILDILTMAYRMERAKKYWTIVHFRARSKKGRL